MELRIWIVGIITWHICAVHFSYGAGTAGAYQTSLLNLLFSNYEKDVRPICETDEPVDVKVGIAIRQIIELDEPKQILYVNAWLRLTWYDCNLRWNASDYGNISNIIVPYSKVWSPDITLYDNAADELPGLKDYLVNIDSSGTCNYNFPTVIQALCRVDVTYFPFDTQICPLKFGSWAHHGWEINTVNKSTEGDISSFVANTEWGLLTVPVTNNIVYYGCCPEPYPDVTFDVTMKRKPLFYVLNLLFPCLLITSVALLGFMLPPDAGEKVSLEITVLLSLAVFLLVVSETLPASSENFPFIGAYFIVAMMLVSLSTLLTVVVLNIHHKGDYNRPVPQWIKTIVFTYLGRVMFVKTESRSVYPMKAFSESSQKSNGNDNKAFHQEAYINGYQCSGLSYLDDIMFDFEELHNKQFSKCNGNGRTNTDSDIQERPLGNEFRERVITPAPANPEFDIANSSNSQPTTQSLLHILRQQLLIMEREDYRKESQHKHDHISSEWKKVGIILDRFFLALFTFTMVVSTMAILLRLSA